MKKIASVFYMTYIISLGFIGLHLSTIVVVRGYYVDVTILCFSIKAGILHLIVKHFCWEHSIP